MQIFQADGFLLRITKVQVGQVIFNERCFWKTIWYEISKFIAATLIMKKEKRCKFAAAKYARSRFTCIRAFFRTDRGISMSRRCCICAYTLSSRALTFFATYQDALFKIDILNVLMTHTTYLERVKLFPNKFRLCLYFLLHLLLWRSLAWWRFKGGRCIYAHIEAPSKLATSIAHTQLLKACTDEISFISKIIIIIWLTKK